MFQTIKKGLALLLGLIAITVLVFNSYGIEPTLKLILDRLESRSGTQVKFTSASGNLLTGSLSLNGLRITRKVEGRNSFDLEVAHLTADMAWLRLFDPEWQLDHVDLLGVKGDFAVYPRQGGEGSRLAGGNVFQARRVFISQADLRFTNFRDDPQGVPLKVGISRMEIDEYRSRWSLYDLLFHSTLEGKIDGEPFGFTRDVKEGKQEVHWKLAGLPMAKWGSAWAGGAAKAMVGRVDVTVDSAWPVEDPRTIHMSWKVEARDKGWTSSQFQGTMQRGQFEGAQSLADAGLWKVVGEGMADKAVSKIQSKLGEFRDRFFGHR
jgi:hypothetical protein